MRAALVLTALALGCVGCSQTPPPEAKAADTKAADLTAIKALEDHFVAAVKTKDIKAIMSYYVPDQSLVVFDVVPPRQYVGAAAYAKDWEELLTLIPGPIETSIADLDVTVGGGDVAYSHSIQHLAGVMKKKRKFDLTVRVTDGYKKINGQWLIAHEHVSVPVDVLTGKSDLRSKP